MKPRAERFSVEGLLSFRPMGQTDWSQGMTINISPSGVLFRTGHGVEIDKIVQLIFVLPTQLPGKSQGDVVFCKGQIVRTVTPNASDRQTHLGAKILDYISGAR